MTTEERLTATQESLAVFWGFNAAMTERFNAHIATVAFRFIEGAEGERPPRENDGADVHLTQHLGEGSVLVTGDARLIALVDRSGTYQAPWVRSLGELDELPDGPPWGESAREHARAFKRK